MRPVSVFANGPDSEIERLRAQLRGPWRQAARAVMVLLSLHELPPAQIAGLLECHPGTARRWIARFNGEGWPGSPTGPGPGGPGSAAASWPGGSPRCWPVWARGRCPGSGGTWAGPLSARGRCTGGSGWWRSGGGPS